MELKLVLLYTLNIFLRYLLILFIISVLPEKVFKNPKHLSLGLYLCYFINCTYLISYNTFNTEVNSMCPLMFIQMFYKITFTIDSVRLFLITKEIPVLKLTELFIC
jgi:hypothetical protein